MEEPERGLWVTDTEEQAKLDIGKLVVFGGIPHRVTRVVPVARLKWEVRGVPQPDHPGPS